MYDKYVPISMHASESQALKNLIAIVSKEASQVLIWDGLTHFEMVKKTFIKCKYKYIYIYVIVFFFYSFLLETSLNGNNACFLHEITLW